LKQEESQSASVGFTAKIPEAKLTLTADAYIVTIKDRVVLTDQFSRPGSCCWNSCCSIKRFV
jgi:iron complex outermembrane receptor protein